MNGFADTTFIILLSFLFFDLAFICTVIILQTIFKDKLVIQKRMLSFFNKDTQKKIMQPKVKAGKGIFANKLKISETIANELQTAGIMMRPEEFAMIWLVVSFVPSGLLVLLTGNAAIAITAAIIGIILPPAYIKKQKKKCVIAFENQLGDALVTMCNCLHSGLTLGQAFENIATEMSAPISKEFTRVCTEIKYGTTIEKSLNAMVDRIGSDDLMFTVSAIIIQRQVGGNLSEILSNISETIKARVKLKGDIKVMTATGRMSGLVIGVLPVLIGLIIFLMNPSYIKDFVETDLGKVLLGIGAVMEFFGFLAINKILDIKY